MKTAIKIILPLLILGGAYKALMLPNSDVGYMPEQPIPYSHKLHAGDKKIACQYCHVGVEKGAHATVPALNVCMNCHKSIKTDSPHIQKLTKAFERGQSIQWTRVTDLPDHVKFVHKRHIAKGVNCETCHGKVYEMEKVAKVETLHMGMCVSCHRDPHSKLKPENDKDRIQLLDAKLNPAPTNCSTCHY